MADFFSNFFFCLFGNDLVKLESEVYWLLLLPVFAIITQTDLDGNENNTADVVGELEVNCRVLVNYEILLFF